MKKHLLISLTMMAGLMAANFAGAATAPVRNQSFEKVIYLATPSGDGSGRSYDSAKSMETDADLMQIQAGMIIENIFVIVDEAVLGVTSLSVGDDDSATGFLPVAATDTFLATAQMLGYASTAKGSYLKDSSSNPAAKYYSVSTKEVKLDAAGTLGATGKARVIIRGHYESYP